MSVDLTGPLYDMLKKKQHEFDAAKDAGKDSEAQIKALEVARILHRIAQNNPVQSKQLEEKAKMWELIGNGAAPLRPEPPKPYKKPVPQTDSGNNSEEDNYSAQVDALISKSSVRWQDIGGLATVKRLMQETVVIAGLQRPDAIKPWKGILLFGPPGTGKTLIAAAAAGSLNATFYNVAADKILSKYVGDSSKLIAALYDSARAHSPSIVFIDEFDSMCMSRDGEANQASRNLLTSLLTCLDGMKDKDSNSLLLTLAATNTPWDMDPAILSRFPRRIYVPLPDAEACESIIRIQLKDLDISKVNLKDIAERCVAGYYSGRDLSSFTQLAMWNMIHDSNKDLHKLADLPFEELQKRSLKTRPLQQEDFEEAFKQIHSPLTKEKIEEYERWMKNYGEGS